MAEAVLQQPTARSSSQEGSGAGLIAGLIILVSIPLLFIFGTAVGLFRGVGPNPSGSTRAQAIDPRPNSAVAQLLASFKTASNVDDYLRDNSNVITTYTANLTVFIQKLKEGDPAYASIQNKDKVIAMAENMVQLLTNMATAAQAGDKPTATKLAAQFRVDVDKLQALASPSVDVIAQQLANDNAASGYTKYPYSKDNREQLFTTNTGASDCSSFASYLLKLAGNAAIPPLTTVELYNAAQAHRFGLSIVAESSASGGIDNATIKATLAVGDIMLSGDDTYANGGGSSGSRHAVTYIGNGLVGESTSANGKDGVQTDTLDNRLTRHNQVIIRWDGYGQ